MPDPPTDSDQEPDDDRDCGCSPLVAFAILGVVATPFIIIMSMIL